ncbi:hypothetical protein ACFSUS_07670 [Spirosoma soli]|uniref:DUF4251 domain-containing protein n=1 Tax=Spirosoma soli TaxID=1770529 RepID=A0ABW5M0H5_9BACT
MSQIYLTLLALTSALMVRAQAPARTWQYEKTVDRAGGTVYKATLPSTNVLQFEYPYTGGSIVTLTLRRKGGDTYAYLEVSKGMFTRSFQGGNANIQFDGKRAVAYSLSAAANGRANIVFFDAEQRLIGQIRTAKAMVVQLQFAGQRPREIRFNTAGLRWDH